jgi:hypothetical protein
MPNFNSLVMDPDEEVLNTSRNISDDKEPKLYRQAINRPNGDLWHIAIEAEMDAYPHNITWNVIDRPTQTMIVDIKWGFKIKRLSIGSVDKFKA